MDEVEGPALRTRRETLGALGVEPEDVPDSINVNVGDRGVGVLELDAAILLLLYTEGNTIMLDNTEGIPTDAEIISTKIATEFDPQFTEGSVLIIYASASLSNSRIHIRRANLQIDAGDDEDDD